MLAPKTLEAIQAYNEDMFYWEDIQVALGDPEISRDIHHVKLEQVIAILSCLEPQLRGLFSGERYVALRAVQAQRVEARKAELSRYSEDWRRQNDG